MARSKNVQDAIDCLEDLKKKPTTSASDKKKISKKLKELKKYY